MKKAIFINSLLITALISASPAYAQSADISKVTNFIQNIIQIFVTIAGLVATGFMVVGGFRYMTSSGNPEALDGAKKTVFVKYPLYATLFLNSLNRLLTS